MRILSNLTAEDYDKMLEGTNLAGLGQAFERVENEIKINGLYMLGLACLESGYGTSSFAVKRNNLYGWQAYDSDPGKAKYFNSKEEATLFVAAKLRMNYLTEGGPYYEGVTPSSVDVHYCTDKTHAKKICQIVSTLSQKIDG